ncbi:MAG: RNA 2',3'-cyclic phosphodiesterase [Acidobacteria bacterium]|nr:MAG: RNA 2',3'-cyclic phosphodiesterase [Acidobacteriota bacterium]
MRLFTAIDIPKEVKDNLDELLRRVQPLAKLSWSRVENMHITTKFIGEWPPERLDEMKRTLDGISRPGPIGIAIRGLGWFPNPKHARVFWAGVEGGEPLKILAHSTEQATAKLEVPVEDRPYSPHLTLARIRDRVPLDALRRAVGELERQEFGSFNAASFFLYLSAAGRYTKLAEYPLD